MGRRTEKVFKGTLTETIEVAYTSPQSRVKLIGLLIMADGYVEIDVTKNYEMVFSLAETITFSKIVSQKNKIFKLERPARGNKFDFVIRKSESVASTEVSIFAVIEDNNKALLC